jgi:uncharacterized protein (UPF0297 family)
MVSQSRNVGKVVGITVSIVSEHGPDSSKRESQKQLATTVFNALEDLGVNAVHQAIAFIEASPASYGCPGVARAFHIEFLFEH